MEYVSFLITSIVTLPWFTWASPPPSTLWPVSCSTQEEQHPAPAGSAQPTNPASPLQAHHCLGDSWAAAQPAELKAGIAQPGPEGWAELERQTYLALNRNLQGKEYIFLQLYYIISNKIHRKADNQTMWEFHPNNWQNYHTLLDPCFVIQQMKKINMSVY